MSKSAKERQTSSHPICRNRFRTGFVPRLLFSLVLSVGLSMPFASNALAANLPARPAQYVRDDASMLSQEAENELNRFLRTVHDERNVEILVVTITGLPVRRNFVHQAPSETIESYATKMFNQFQVGDAPANRGVLVLIAKNNRKCRIELGAGYSSSMDRVAKRIITEDFLPKFRSNQYDDGINTGVHQIAKTFANYGATTQDSAINWSWLAVPAGMVGLIGALTGVSLFWTRKRGWGWVVVGLVYVKYLRVRNAITRSSSGARGSSSSSDSFWDSDFGDFGGGGGGGGGGFSSGGGASGSW